MPNYGLEQSERIPRSRSFDLSERTMREWANSQPWCWPYLQLSTVPYLPTGIKLNSFLKLSFFKLIFRFFKCFVSKSVFWSWSLSKPSFYGWSRRRKNIWSRSRGKMARLRNTGIFTCFSQPFIAVFNSVSDPYSFYTDPDPPKILIHPDPAC